MQRLFGLPIEDEDDAQSGIVGSGNRIQLRGALHLRHGFRQFACISQLPGITQMRDRKVGV